VADLVTGRELRWKAAGDETAVRIEESGNRGTLHVGERSIPYVVHARDEQGGWVEIGGKNSRFYVHRHRDEVAVWLDGRTYRLSRVQTGRTAEDNIPSGSGEVRALMPGKVLRIEVRPGDRVVEKQTVIIMESMKMESALTAPQAGTVMAVNCEVGQIVEMGAILVIIE